MTVSHALHAQPTTSPAMTKLQEFLEERRRAKKPMPKFEDYEAQLHALVSAVECEGLGEELARHDVDVPVVVIGGVGHRQVLRCEETYFAPPGEVRVMRSLYSTRDGPGGLALCPMELRAGIVEGRWTPRAAKQALWFVAQMTPQTVEDLYARLGGLTPSKSTLDRLPKAISSDWETRREDFEAALRAQEKVPDTAVAVGLSLDGVMVPMKDGKREEKRQLALAEGKRTRGPAGRQEAACGTLAFYDKDYREEDGTHLGTIRLARMPESKKVTLKSMLTAELMAVLAVRPDLVVVLMGDGAKDNWTYLSALKKQLKASHKIEALELVDFCHAADHLADALNAAYGENTPMARAQFQKLRHVLRHDLKGAIKVTRALLHLHERRPRKKVIERELKYFRKNRKRMLYADFAARGLPIGTGIMEAACKTLVAQRLRCSGMAWADEGGQAILTLRSLIQSKRFDPAWELIAKSYVRAVEVPENVIPIRARR